jgi:hypothetical protein
VLANAKPSLPRPLVTLSLCLCAALALLLASAVSQAAAKPARIGLAKARATGAPKHTRPFRQRAGISARNASTSAPAATSPKPSTSLFDAGCDNGLANWNTAGVGEVVPTITSASARSGSGACQVRLNGSQDRSELILGGNGGGSTAGTVEFHEGDEYWYGFSFDIEQMVYGKPGAHNLFMQFKGESDGSPNFGLQLWDYNGEKGLWSAGTAMQIGNSGERFLAPVSERQWHDVAIHFKASSAGAGFYEIYLDGNLVDDRTGVSMIPPGDSAAYIKNGLYRNGDEIPGTSEIDLDSAKLGTSLEAVQPD